MTGNRALCDGFHDRAIRTARTLRASTHGSGAREGEHAAPCPTQILRDIAAGHWSSDHEAWCRQGFARYLNGAASLEQAFGLDRVARIRRRDAALCRAAALLRPGHSNWAVAEELARLVARHHRVASVRVKDPERRPLSEVEQWVARAFDAYHRVPATPKSLSSIISEAISKRR